MDKEILARIVAMKEEIRDLRRRIEKLDKFLENPPMVSDIVKGTRRDGTIGSIKITGIPDPECRRKDGIRSRYKKLMGRKEAELLELTCQAEEYIQSIGNPEMRIMFRLYFIDGLTWVQVAHRMNAMFPRRRIKFTEDNCRMRSNRFLAEI